METGLPLLHGLLQHTLRSICSSSSTSSTSSSKWVYAVFWRIVPRNFPPPRWEFGGTSLDRSKGNKRNWILVWEDGFCDFNECQESRSDGCLDNNNDRFGAEVFFKMSHEVYNYGEGLLGKVAAENSHKWVHSDTQNGCESSYIASWNASIIDHQPRAWEFQFSSGIQTVAVIAVREGLVQIGSFNKIAEDLNVVLNIQRKFSYLQSIPGVFSIQRPYIPIQIQNPYNSNEIALSTYNINQVNGFNRVFEERSNYFSMISINMGRNNNNNNNNSNKNTLQDNGTQQGSPPSFWSSHSSLPNMPCSLGALHSMIPNNEVPIPHYNHSQVHETNRINSTGQRVKVEDCGFHVADDGDGNGKIRS